MFSTLCLRAIWPVDQMSLLYGKASVGWNSKPWIRHVPFARPQSSILPRRATRSNGDRVSNLAISPSARSLMAIWVNQRVGRKICPSSYDPRRALVLCVTWAGLCGMRLLRQPRRDVANTRKQLVFAFRHYAHSSAATPRQGSQRRSPYWCFGPSAMMNRTASEWQGSAQRVRRCFGLRTCCNNTYRSPAPFICSAWARWSTGPGRSWCRF